MTPSDALAALQSAASDTSASAIAYFDDVNFASQLCDDLATVEGTNYDLSAPLADARTILQRVAALHHSPTAKEQLMSALSTAEAVLNADPGLRMAQQHATALGDMRSRQLRDELQRAQLQCEADVNNIAQRLQLDEAQALAASAGDVERIEQQALVQLKQIQADEQAAAAAKDFRRAKELKDLSVECRARAEAACSKRKQQLHQQLQELRSAAAAASTRAQQPVTAVQADQRLKDCDAMAASLSALIPRAAQLLARQPAWPRHEALLRFELPLFVWKQHLLFKKEWASRFVVLRGSRLYYSNGKSGHPNSLEGSLAFMRSNPAPDGHYCVDLHGMRALLLPLASPCCV
jgi:hypothetical protein